MDDFVYNAPDKWQHTFANASISEKHRLIIETAQLDLPTAFINEVDLTECVLELRKWYEVQREFKCILELIATIKTFQPTLYQVSFFIYDDFLLDYYLFKGDQVEVGLIVERFIQDPLRAEDYLFQVVNKLIYYRLWRLAVHLVSRTYKRILTNSALIEDAAFELASTLYAGALQQQYLLYKEKGEFDWVLFRGKLVNYDFLPDDEKRGLFVMALTGDESLLVRLPDFFVEERRNCLTLLNGLFMKDCMESLDTGFIGPQLWWDYLSAYWENNARGKKPDKYFKLNGKRFSEFVHDTTQRTLTPRVEDSIATVWGAVYIYDFLHEIDLICCDVYDHAISLFVDLKKELILANRPYLWRFHFLHLRNKSKSVSQEVYDLENRVFVDCFEAKQIGTDGGDDWQVAVDQLLELLDGDRKIDDRKKRGRR